MSDDGYKKDWRDHLPTTSQMLANGEPGVANCFLFEVDGIEIGIFKEVKGLQFNVGTVDIVEGGQNGYVHKGMGKVTWSNIILKRGMTASDALYKWVQSSSGSGVSKVVRKTGAITAISQSGDRLRAWNIIDAYPVRWSGPEFSVDSRTPLEEELEIVHHGFTSKTF